MRILGCTCLCPSSVVSWVIQFAILGTLTLALGLICLAFTFWARRPNQVIDRVLVTSQPSAA